MEPNMIETWTIDSRTMQQPMHTSGMVVRFSISPLMANALNGEVISPPTEGHDPIRLLCEAGEVYAATRSMAH